MNDWWNDDSIEIGDRITAMENEIRRLREENHDLCNRLVAEKFAEFLVAPICVRK